jgi:hypothetical protein
MVYSVPFDIIYQMKLFRIQNSDGQGPFRAENSRRRGLMEPIYRFYSNNWHPLPSDDFSYSYTSDIPTYVQFACDSIETLQKWFVLTDDMIQRALYLMQENASMAGINKLVMEGLEDLGFYIAEIDIADEYCEYGQSLNQLQYDTRKIINVSIHPVKTVYKGHL